MKPIFAETFLEPLLSNFNLSSIVGVQQLREVIKGWNEEIQAGKINKLKEEEIKSRFINTVFGDLLGYNYGNERHWHLREEQKSITDGTRPDAALGYFTISESSREKVKSDVRAIVEIKDARTDLDERQKRKGNPTPVDQAFGYVSKMGGSCKWVIVSNMLEIRVYHSLDRSKCQKYTFQELSIDDKLKEFIFLFHRDFLIRPHSSSRTDNLFERSKKVSSQIESIHIIDQIYSSLKNFEGLGFVDPAYLSSIKPFNILEDYVWHYQPTTLFTINSEIYSLLSRVTIEAGKISFSPSLEKEIQDQDIIDARYKLQWSLRFLNHCMIYHVSAIKDYASVQNRNKGTLGFSIRHSFNFNEGTEGITKEIYILENTKCDCLSCNNRELNLKRMLEKLQVAEGNQEFETAEYAYGYYLVASTDFKSCYRVLKTIEDKTKNDEGKEIDYFLAKYNLKLLFNLISYYEFADSAKILSDIKSIDLDKTLHDELAFGIDGTVRTYLMQLKDDSLIYRIQDEIEELCRKINDMKSLYENGGTQTGPIYHNQLKVQYYKLYCHVNLNYIIYDGFARYKRLSVRVFEGLVNSYSTTGAGLERFDLFTLQEAILQIPRQDLSRILKNINWLEADDKVAVGIVKILQNFIKSYLKKGLFGNYHKERLLQIALQSFYFRERFNTLFGNIFIVLGKLRIDNDEFEIVKEEIIGFVELEDELHWFNLEPFSVFVIKHPNIFTASELEKLLKIAIHRDDFNNHKYDNLINNLTIALKEGYPGHLVKDMHLVQSAILNNTSNNGNRDTLQKTICLTSILDAECKQILLGKYLEVLQSEFSAFLFENLLRNDLGDHFVDRFFEQYVLSINSGMDFRDYGKYGITSHSFINFIIVVYSSNISLRRSEFSLLSNLNSLEHWLLHPDDLTDFDANWLIDLNYPAILNRLSTITGIEDVVESQLVRGYNSTLAEIKYKYLTV